MKRAITNAALALMVFALPGISAGSQPNRHRQILKQPTEIEGYSCAKGYAWLYADGGLASCTVAQDTPFGEAVVPVGSLITLSTEGRPLYVGLVRDTQIVDYTCQGGGVLGSSEADTTEFYPSGKLKVCWLAGDQSVQGIPCMGAGGFLGAVFRKAHSPSAVFYESGKLHSCTLSKNFGAQRRGEQFVQGP